MNTMRTCGITALLCLIIVAGCGDDTTNGVGETWTDPTSGLTWQVTPISDKSGQEDWSWFAAKTYCNDLNLAGHTDWRLPDIGELRSLIRGCPVTEMGSATCEVEEGGCLDSTCTYSSCDYDDNLCGCCESFAGPADGCYWPDEMQGPCGDYWSSSAVEDLDDFAWYVRFDHGYVDFFVDVFDGFGVFVRCVR